MLRGNPNSAPGEASSRYESLRRDAANRIGGPVCRPWDTIALESDQYRGELTSSDAVCHLTSLVRLLSRMAIALDGERRREVLPHRPKVEVCQKWREVRAL